MYFFQPLKTEPKPQVEEARFLDPRIGQRGAVRNKRALAFHEAGKFQAEAQRLRMKVFFSVADPNLDPPDPHVFGPPGSGSGSISQMYGSFYHLAKKVRKTLIPTAL